jgi:hypothetical protein
VPANVRCKSISVRCARENVRRVHANVRRASAFVGFFFVLFDAAKRTKNGSTILTRSVYRLRLDGTKPKAFSWSDSGIKSSIWSLRRFFDGQSHEARFNRRSELMRATARLFKRSLPYSTLSCLSAAGRRSEFLASSRFWFFFRHEKEQRIEKIKSCNQFPGFAAVRVCRPLTGRVEKNQ